MPLIRHGVTEVEEVCEGCSKPAEHYDAVVGSRVCARAAARSSPDYYSLGLSGSGLRACEDTQARG